MAVATSPVTPELVRRADFEQLCSQCNFEQGRPAELVELLTVLIEAYQHLLSLGYVIPRPVTTIRDPRDYDRFAVTKAGQQWAAGVDLIPEDRAGYITTLLRLAPSLDPITKQYAEEALITYERRAFFASAVMIGAASESLVYHMMDALLKAVHGTPEEKNVQKAINNRSLSTMFDTLKKNIHRAKSKPSGAMTLDVHEDNDPQLIALMDAIRVQRNDAVHPTAGWVSLEAVHITLSAFPAICKKAYDLIEWFNTNQL